MSSTGRIKDRQPDDFYATPDWCTDAILPELDLSGCILEPAAGEGAIALRLLNGGVLPEQIALNEIDSERAKVCAARTGIGTTVSDFFALSYTGAYDLIITNPPFMLAQEFVEHARQLVGPYGEVAMLLRLNFLSSLGRIDFWRENPAHVHVLPQRPSFCKISRDVYRCAHCKRSWKVPHEAGPFAVPVDEQCDCGEVPTFQKTVKTSNDSCEYMWLTLGPRHTQQWSILDIRPQRFWARVLKSEGCWLWKGAHPGKYGQLDGRGAHVVSWELHFGPVPDGMHVCHKCDNPPCVRPDHLFLGTPLDNMTDKIAKGRDVRGVDVVTAKLTPLQVLEIRRRYDAGETQVQLAEAFGIGQPHISVLVRGMAWRQEDGPIGGAFLTKEEVVGIRETYASTQCSYEHLAKQYGVHPTTIRSVVLRKSFAAVP
jgi:hypothetical protein